jgi:putative Ca2+/H+ antiporter (TMEM165/GDT1 family)
VPRAAGLFFAAALCAVVAYRLSSRLSADEARLEAFLTSTLVVALAEIGDKTQLLSLLLAARYKRPLPIVAGILIATLANHFVAGAFGAWVSSLFSPQILRWIVGVSLLAIAAWTLKPDKFDGEVRESTRYGLFALTCVVFFVAEIGDKTQIATIVLAARYQSLVAVVTGTTLGMMIANVPVVFLGSVAAHRIPFKLVRVIAAIVFAVLGVAALAGWGA